MYRGTTPTHIFNVNVDCQAATVLYITYQQNGTTVIEKELEDATIDESSITVHLTQEDTLAFSEDGKVSVQIRVGFEDGSRLASNVIETTSKKILKDGVI